MMKLDKEYSRVINKIENTRKKNPNAKEIDDAIAEVKKLYQQDADKIKSMTLEDVKKDRRDRRTSAVKNTGKALLWGAGMASKAVSIYGVVQITPTLIEAGGALTKFLNSEAGAAAIDRILKNIGKTPVH